MYLMIHSCASCENPQRVLLRLQISNRFLNGLDYASLYKHSPSCLTVHLTGAFAEEIHNL